MSTEIKELSLLEELELLAQKILSYNLEQENKQ